MAIMFLGIVIMFVCVVLVMSLPITGVEGVDSVVPAAAEVVKQSTHTPGPWEVFGFIGKPGLMHVRACIGEDRVGRKQYQEVPINQADARLIAAAPDLLAACNYALSAIKALQADQDGSAISPARNQLQRAVDKVA